MIISKPRHLEPVRSVVFSLPWIMFQNIVPGGKRAIIVYVCMFTQNYARLVGLGRGGVDKFASFVRLNIAPAFVQR